MPGRRQAREAALQLLYQRDANPDIKPQVARDMLEELINFQPLRDLAWQLYVGTASELPAIDKRLQDVAHNWRLSRMAMTDRNILRMGLYEMTTIGTPAAVVLDECIELARLYGNAQSGQFVNGILDKLMPGGSQTVLTGEEPAEVPAQPSSSMTLE